MVKHESVPVGVDPQPAGGAIPHIEVTFSGDGLSIDVTSTKDLSNVVLVFDDGTHYKFDNLNQGTTGTFAGIGENTGKLIDYVYIKSGRNHSDEGSGYGERFDSPIELTTTKCSPSIAFRSSSCVRAGWSESEATGTISIACVVATIHHGHTQSYASQMLSWTAAALQTMILLAR